MNGASQAGSFPWPPICTEEEEAWFCQGTSYSHLLEVTQGWVERGHTEEQLSFSYIFVSRLGC